VTAEHRVCWAKAPQQRRDRGRSPGRLTPASISSKREVTWGSAAATQAGGEASRKRAHLAHRNAAPLLAAESGLRQRLGRCKCFGTHVSNRNWDYRSAALSFFLVRRASSATLERRTLARAPSGLSEWTSQLAPPGDGRLACAYLRAEGRAQARSRAAAGSGLQRVSMPSSVWAFRRPGASRQPQRWFTPGNQARRDPWPMAAASRPFELGRSGLFPAGGTGGPGRPGSLFQGGGRR